ncbi:5-formyltetrahydrofolate cyclo-ligase [Ceratina calcarata]|uniref:5-formyltetrahydrofolate cyclo-ligase n=1 Tax=Ceratina calcarata TaxID=156304 RepID=A0AAJ7WDS0_9HYME|nr:5-formyltetrahydrofolate cyclo-ligase [Ceratina calcarata]XP_026672458.1 5-formyltetrahydrofolate cyclo-ligase [Ceratina calcarata]XP_026672459.1 5-formyltetrahydrofolate cyclo-ligase [Ceratina calcarata]XP_026672460.1 5-formyltetrahydrofolate cyclo-ligase [Ceratina calcarata]
MNSLNLAKAALRKKVKDVIKQITIEERQKQSKKVFEKLRSLPLFQKSKRVSIYLSTEDEIDTTQILKYMFDTKKEVFVPTYKGGEMKMVKLLSIEDYEKLPLTKWNIKQPKFNESRENPLENGGLDLVVVPGVAFTASGKRLGHGMGYYDKYLKSCLEKQQTKPHLIGIAFNEQLRDDVPTSEYDVPMDLVLTEK